MSLSSGFFNSQDGDRKYNAEHFASIFDGIINDGIYASIGDCFVVSATDPTSRNVRVGTGRAWFNGTWTVNDAALAVGLPAADLLLPRIDAIVLQVDRRTAYRQNTITIVKGTPAASPAKPTLVTDFEANGYAQYALAYVQQTANQTTAITGSQITNAVGTDETPFVTGIIETLSASELLTKWGAELEEYAAETEAKTDAWYIEKQTEFAAWTATQESAWNKWSLAEQTEFNTWFANLKNELDENQASNLQNQIDKEEIRRIMTAGLEDGTKTVSTDGSVITMTASDGRVLKKVFSNDFATLTATLLSANGITMASMAKTFNSDGSVIKTTLTIN